ncbi:hypothetical protein AB0M87_04365 [Streptomyces sp. NPDC051320]|uniref:hypothetical protein n=1 Tax=Streptomyces sp. NPDC051320 TaxID=3154644 RepID=UPI00343A9586
MPNPTEGRIVLYRLSEQDTRQIIQHRAHNGLSGNTVREGDVCPAVIVRIWDGEPYAAPNLKVLLDGQDNHWAPSRHEGDGPGTWSWPVRA